METKQIILNGDDFGYSKGVNKGIRESIEDGILTSTSVMVNRSAAEEAKGLKLYKSISVGIHLDITNENYFQRWGKVIAILTWPEKKIRAEFNKQIEKFVKIVGKPPDHIDSHHHIHWITGFRKIVLEFSQKNNIPVRSKDASFQIGFYGRSFTNWNGTHLVTPQRLISVINGLSSGVHEIMCHPGYVDSELIKSQTTYLSQREDEVKALTSKKVIDFLKANKDIKIISWKDIRSERK